MRYTKRVFKCCLLAFLSALLLMSAIACVQRDVESQGTRDGYILSLLWWPTYCHNHPELQACAGASFRGFVVQGLLPRSSSRSQRDCGARPGPSDPSKLLDLIPDSSLVQDVWKQYGLCSGLMADSYFALVKTCFIVDSYPRCIH